MTSTSAKHSGNIQCLQPELNHSPGRSAGLESAPDDIHYLIISELMKSSPSAVLAMAHSSKTLCQAALPFIYRDLVLMRSTWDERAYKALIETFKNDTSCKFAQHVHSIAVKADVPAEDLLMILNKIVESGSTLRKLTWETSAHIAESVLDKLQTTWPELELTVCVLNRHEASFVAHRQMDYRLLSSPLLKSLTYNIYLQGYRAEQVVRSEWPRLTRALVAGGQVRVLRIQSQSEGSDSGGVKILDKPDSEKLMRLDVMSGMRLPALEEFTLHQQRETYPWDEEHCRTLRKSMDWSRLRKLDFGNARPDAFFSVFAGILPELKALRFGAGFGGSVALAKSFVESVTALEYLDIARAQSAMDALWPAIMKHKKTLKELILRPTMDAYQKQEYIDFNCLMTVADHFLALERLGWHVPCKKTKLDLFMHLPSEASDYSARLTQDVMGTIAPPPFDKHKSKTAAIKIMETISRRQRRPLECLTLHISRTGAADRAQTYLMSTNMQVKRRKGINVMEEDRYETRGRQRWGGPTNLEDELSLNEE